MSLRPGSTQVGPLAEGLWVEEPGFGTEELPIVSVVVPFFYRSPEKSLLSAVARHGVLPM